MIITINRKGSMHGKMSVNPIVMVSMSSSRKYSEYQVLNKQTPEPAPLLFTSRVFAEQVLHITDDGPGIEVDVSPGSGWISTRGRRRLYGKC